MGQAETRHELAERTYRLAAPIGTRDAGARLATLLTDPALDYTLVAVRPRGTGQTEIKSFGFNRLIEQQGKILIGEALNIIQQFSTRMVTQDEVDLIRKLTGERVPATVDAALRRRLQPYRFALRNSLRNLPCGSH